MSPGDEAAGTAAAGSGAGAVGAAPAGPKADAPLATATVAARLMATRPAARGKRAGIRISVAARRRLSVSPTMAGFSARSGRHLSALTEI